MLTERVDIQICRTIVPLMSLKGKRSWHIIKLTSTHLIAIIERTSLKN